MTDAAPPWASDYVGIPWRSGGRDRDAVDCYGLVRMVMEERGGVRLPLFDTVSATDLMRAYDEIEADTRNWRRVEFGAERPFDVLQVRRVFKHDGRFVSRAVHIGIVVGGGKVLHAEGDSAAGVVLADLDHMRRQTKAVWRHATLCAGQEGPAGSPFDCRQFIVEPGASIADIDLAHARQKIPLEPRSGTTKAVSWIPEPAYVPRSTSNSLSSPANGLKSFRQCIT